MNNRDMDWDISGYFNATGSNTNATNSNASEGDYFENKSSNDPGHSETIHWGRPHAGPNAPNIPMAVFLVMCICVSTIGNGAVLYIAILKMKRTSFGRLTLLISSLALSDFLQAFSLMTPQLFKNIYGEWACGILICKVHSSLRSMQTNVSISILALITIERFLYLDKLSGGSENKSLYIAINILVWFVHIALAVPLGMWSTVLYSPRMCTIPAKTIAMTQEYVVVVKTAFFFVPLVIMWICNIGIIYKTRKSSLSVRPLQVNWQPQRANTGRVEKEKRTIMTCLILALVFTVTHVPFETCLFILKSANSRQQVQQVTNLMFYLWPLTILNACINPFIYSVFFKEFRQRVKDMMGCRNSSACLRTCSSKDSTPANIPHSSSRTCQTASTENEVISPGSRNSNTHPGGARFDYSGNAGNNAEAGCANEHSGTYQVVCISSCDVNVPHIRATQRHQINNTLSPISIDT